MYQRVSVIPTLTLAAYVATDCVGGTMIFNHNSNTNNLRILRVHIVDVEQQDEEYNLHLFEINPSATADTDADQYLPAAADLAAHLTVINIPTTAYTASTAENIAEVEVDRAVWCKDFDNIFGVLECVATPDYAAADDLTVSLIFETR